MELLKIPDKEANFCSHKLVRQLLGERAGIDKKQYWKIIFTFRDLGFIPKINTRGIYRNQMYENE